MSKQLSYEGPFSTEEEETSYFLLTIGNEKIKLYFTEGLGAFLNKEEFANISEEAYKILCTILGQPEFAQTSDLIIH